MEANSNISGQWVSDDNMFSGRWINKNTGQRITITNSVIDNNEMILMTSIGQMSMDEWSRDYVQDIDEEPAISIKESKPIKQTKTTSNMSSEVVDDYLLPEDKALLSGKPVQFQPASVLDSAPSIPAQPTILQSTTHVKNNEVLDKFFKDNTVTTHININLDFNEDELKTLMKYMDINMDDVSEYIYENIINKDAIKEQINNIVLNKIK